MTKQKLATIQIIADVQPIENADSIEKVRIKDAWVVSQKNTFKVGDYCVFFEIDSLLPVDNPAFAFLAKDNKPKNVIINGKEHINYGYHLKTIKLRGQISQGLVLPTDSNLLSWKNILKIVHAGDDFTDMLKIVKYEPPIPTRLSGEIKGRRPSHIPKTDEERVQNFGEVVDKLQEHVH